MCILQILLKLTQTRTHLLHYLNVPLNPMYLIWMQVGILCVKKKEI